MPYNFDEIINRENTDALKVEPGILYERFGEKKMIPLWVADMDFKAPQPVIDAIVERAKHGIYGYTIRLNDYYKAVMDWEKKRHNWAVKKEWIVFTPGIVPAVNYMIQAYCLAGDKVMIQTPVYYPFGTAIVNNGCQVVDNPLIFDNGHYSIDFDDFEQKASDPRLKVFVLCSPHNPIGRIWTKDELTRIGEICVRHDVIVIADEIHHDLILDGNKHHVFANISEALAMQSIICTAPSKTFNLAGLNTSNIIIPNKKLRLKYEQVLENNSIWGQNPMSIDGMKAAYNHGDEWLDELLIYLEENVQYMDSFLKERLPMVKLIKPEATYLAWLDFREVTVDDAILEKIIFHDALVALDGGTWFGSNGSGFMRINFACPRSVLSEALERIEKSVKAYLEKE